MLGLRESPQSHHHGEKNSLQVVNRRWNGPGVPHPHRWLDRPHVLRRS